MNAQKQNATINGDLNIALNNGSSMHIIESILMNGANPNELNSEDVTPLYTAVIRNNANLVKLLLKYGADPDVMVKSGTDSPRMNAYDNLRVDIYALFKNPSPSPIKNIQPHKEVKSADINRVKMGIMANKIKRFYASRKLNKLCPNLYDCVSFGLEIERTRRFFDFKSFKHVKMPTLKLSQSSSNGIIIIMDYEKGGLKSTAIMKCAVNNYADNLLLEYAIGLHINGMCEYLPFFVTTYGMYELNRTNNDAVELYKMMKREAGKMQLHVRPSQMFKGISYDGTSKFCPNNEYFCILVEYINKPMFVEDIAVRPSFFLSELLSIMAQVYIPLSILGDRFAHNDLHDGNVLIYELPEYSYYEYVFYKNENGQRIEHRFKTRYLVKIIDYGRCFFKYERDGVTYSLERIIDDIKATQPKCMKNHGIDRSFVKYRKSADLRFSTIITEFVIKQHFKGAGGIKKKKALSPIMASLIDIMNAYKDAFKKPIKIKQPFLSEQPF